MYTLTFTVFLPLILLLASAKGLAFTTPPLDPPYCQDFATLNIAWWHNWSPSPNCQRPGFVPYSWSGGSFPLVDESGYVLWLNEPEVTKQSNLTPAQAATRYALYTALHPTARIVAVNANIWAGLWVQQFYGLISQRPYALGVHVYLEQWITVDEASRRLDDLHAIAQSPIWITEFGACDGSVETFSALLDMFDGKSYIERYAAYTNRQYGQWYDICPGVELIRGGELTPVGEVYADRR